MTAKKLVNRGDAIVLANPDTGATEEVPSGGTVVAADWPGLADRPDFTEAAAAKRKTASKKGGSDAGAD